MSDYTYDFDINSDFSIKPKIDRKHAENSYKIKASINLYIDSKKSEKGDKNSNSSNKGIWLVMLSSNYSKSKSFEFSRDAFRRAWQLRKRDACRQPYIQK